MPKWNSGQPGYGLFDMPDRCPVCHHLIVIGGPSSYLLHTDVSEADLFYFCPNPDCRRGFIGIYKLNGQESASLIRFLPNKPVQQELPQILNEISPKFVSIYKEAWEAKQAGLSQICGPGFRKAFEFLIKDYAKQKVGADEKKREQIEKTFAGKVVNDYIGDARIQSVAKRALWLGNDETHYLREWEKHDINDLIALIRLTIHWIEIEQLSQDYMTEMPEGGSD